MISAETGSREPEQTRETVHEQGRRWGQFDCRTQLPGEVDAGQVTAQLSDGVLSVQAPKAQATQSRVEITGG